MPITYLKRLLGFGTDPKEELRPLWHRTVEIAREPHWYADCKVADTVDGRFAMMVAALAIVILRMERSASLVPKSALLTELFVDDMDGQLREFGVGDVVVGKNMGKLMSMVGGRLGAYRTGLAEDGPSLAQAVERNVTFADGGLEAGGARCVADGLRALTGQLAQIDDEQLLRAEIAR